MAARDKWARVDAARAPAGRKRMGTTSNGGSLLVVGADGLHEALPEVGVERTAALVRFGAVDVGGRLGHAVRSLFLGPQSDGALIDHPQELRLRDRLFLLPAAAMRGERWPLRTT